MRIPPIQLVPPARTLFLVGISSLVASTWLITSIALAASPVIAINQDAATVNVTGQALREHLSVLMGSGAILASSMARTDYFSSMRASQSHGRKLSPHSAASALSPFGF